MKRIILFLSFLITFTLFAQIPMGKNAKLGKNELKNKLITANFNFLKESKKSERNLHIKASGSQYINRVFYEQLYREEIKIWIEENEYENIKSIYIFPEKNINREKLLKLLEFEKWEFLYINKYEQEIYKYKDFYIILMPYGGNGSKVGDISITFEKPE